jgi:hypothetical protein
MSALTQEELATNAITWEHINRVQSLMQQVVSRLLIRAVVHDRSKLAPPEVEIFTIYTAKLKGLTYGSDEYKQCLVEMGPALDHHYAQNDHHPEHHGNGVNGMDLLGLIEMLCDWKAAGERHANGSLPQSLEVNAPRFKIDSQLAQILENTARRLWPESFPQDSA